MFSVMKEALSLLLLLLTLLFSPVSAATSASAREGMVRRGVVNINTATPEELRELPGIGPKKAEQIVEYREKHPFVRVSQLRKIKGIGPETLKRMQPYVVLDGPTDLRWVPDDKSGVPR